MSNKQDSPKWAWMSWREQHVGTCWTSYLTYDTLVWTYNYYMIIWANQWLMFHFIRSNGIIYSLPSIKYKTISQRCTKRKFISRRLQKLSILLVLSHTQTHTQTQRMTQASNQFGYFTVKAVCIINFKACFGFVEQKATTTHYLSKPV